MRLNRFVAAATGLSRRAADEAIASGRVSVSGQTGQLGQDVQAGQTVTLDSQELVLPGLDYIILNKPAGYVTSRSGQGARTIYELLPTELSHLKPVGRLDKDSEGLLLLTNDGELANQLTHPRYVKQKRYLVWLNRALEPSDADKLRAGVKLPDGLSRLEVKVLASGEVSVSLTEGRNRQIRRTFQTLNYQVKRLQRVEFGKLKLAGLAPGRFKSITRKTIDD